MNEHRKLCSFADRVNFFCKTRSHIYFGMESLLRWRFLSLEVNRERSLF